MTVPALTLLYFPFPGRAAAIRDALAIGRIAYTDRHVSFDEFGAMKAADSLPFGALPVLEVSHGDGAPPVRISQSNAILRYVGRLSALYPVEDLVASARVDEAMDACDDLMRQMSASIGEADPARKAAIREEMASTSLPRDFARLERMLEGRGPYFGGDKLSVADLKIWHGINKLTDGSLDGIPTTVADGFKALGAWRERVAAERARLLA